MDFENFNLYGVVNVSVCLILKFWGIFSVFVKFGVWGLLILLVLYNLDWLSLMYFLNYILLLYLILEYGFLLFEFWFGDYIL